MARENIDKAKDILKALTLKGAVDLAAEDRIKAEEAKIQAMENIFKSKQILSAIMMQNAVDLAGKDREERELEEKQRTEEAEGNYFILIISYLIILNHIKLFLLT